MYTPFVVEDLESTVREGLRGGTKMQVTGHKEENDSKLKKIYIV